MTDMEAKGELCQSCGRDMRRHAAQGSYRGGAPPREFCEGCYHEGEFTLPDVSIEEMAGISARALMDNDPALEPGEALEKAREVLPTLKRWREPHPERTHSHR